MSHTPINLFKDWLELYVATAGYTFSRGMWVEPKTTTSKFVAVWSNPGRSQNGSIQYPHIRMIITGKLNGRSIQGDAEIAENFAQSVIDAAIANYKTGCIMKIRQLGSIMGPNYTESGRPWYEINFELIC